MNTEGQNLLLLLNWMSPAFPIGSFAYSHGFEWAVANGDVKTADDVSAWIADVIRTGSGWTDAVFFARCWQDESWELNALALALAGSAERFQETTELGRNFRIASSVWLDTQRDDGEICYPVAAGLACKQAGIAKEQALIAYLQAFSSALVSVAVRLVPLGQTKGLAVLRDLSGVIAATASRAAAATLDDLGSQAISAEIAAMKHETLETRIFRT